MTYDYVCTACAHVWEAEQRITADPLKDCPNCHQATAKRQISGGQGFILKGGGWYSDLYSSAKPAAAADSAHESKPAATGPKPESKSEAKGESKSESKTEKTASPSASGTSSSPAASSAS
jgi:putative FmdB family regulatory protein